ncbi:hypothetical protein PsAD37_03551 [Pseudovibrio sp. Ad37]|nr:hypothetical protein PsAD37_03551 [Pseudovibrio sp. Ad37]KZL25088.1 hypothetical protein PsWM33_02289 [Pseudovibrio sp. WM33]
MSYFILQSSDDQNSRRDYSPKKDETQKIIKKHTEIGSRFARTSCLNDANNR